MGSGPGSLENEPGFVDGHQVVVRVNNYKTGERQGFRTDVHYSFYGVSIKKTAEELKRDGVTLCMSKVPNAHAIESEWHRRNNKMIGVDYRPHFRRRANFWFCETYVPTVSDYLALFYMLDRHIATTGFAAIIEILLADPKSIYLTGFDFFRSGVHNVNEPWRRKNMDDPIRHEPERELAWLALNWSNHPFVADRALSRALSFASV